MTKPKVSDDELKAILQHNSIRYVNAMWGVSKARCRKIRDANGWAPITGRAPNGIYGHGERNA